MVSLFIRLSELISVNGKEWKTHYYISNDRGIAPYFLEKVLQEWTVETMHFYKDCALKEDKRKTNKGAFSFSILNLTFNQQVQQQLE